MPGIILLLCLSISLSLNAKPLNDTTTFSVETDPVALMYGGYSLFLWVAPKAQKYWRLGIGAYSMERSDMLVNFNTGDINNDAEVELGVALFYESYINEKRGGWHLGVKLAQEDLLVKDSTTNSLADKSTIAIFLSYVGYRWNLDTHFYLRGWLGVGYAEEKDNEFEFNGNTYTINPIVASGALHIGYEF